MKPTLRCVLVFVAGIGVALLSAIISPRLWTLWIAYVGLAVLAAGLDAVFGLSARRLQLRVAAPDTLYIGDRAQLKIEFAAAGRRVPAICVLADMNDLLEPQAARVTTEVPLVPLRRGVARVGALWLRWSGPFGLVRRQIVRRVDREIPVIPNVRAVRQAALRFFTQREFLSGLKIEHYVGDGSEFESLREYVPGLDHRAMNWKASARHRKLLCEEFRAERNHRVMLAVDTGHLMSEPMGGIPKLDHAINAGLLLTYVCIRTGDRVGWYGFDEKPRSFSEPEGGAQALRRMQQLTTQFEYSHGETNFTLGLVELSARLRRRTLIVLLTDFVDTVTAELMVENLARLSRRHLVMFVTLRDPNLEELAWRRPRSLGDVHRSVVAQDFVRERELVLRRLGRHGVHCIDARPEEVTTQLLNRYLDIKRREQL